jgi:hypothetical protein
MAFLVFSESENMYGKLSRQCYSHWVPDSKAVNNPSQKKKKKSINYFQGRLISKHVIRCSKNSFYIISSTIIFLLLIIEGLLQLLHTAQMLGVVVLKRGSGELFAWADPELQFS